MLANLGAADDDWLAASFWQAGMGVVGLARPIPAEGQRLERNMSRWKLL